MTDAFPGPDPYDPDITDEELAAYDELADDYYDYDDTLSCGCCACCGCDCDYWDDLYDYTDLPLDDDEDD